MYFSRIEQTNKETDTTLYHSLFWEWQDPRVLVRGDQRSYQNHCKTKERAKWLCKATRTRENDLLGQSLIRPLHHDYSLLNRCINKFHEFRLKKSNFGHIFEIWLHCEQDPFTVPVHNPLAARLACYSREIPTIESLLTDLDLVKFLVKNVAKFLPLSTTLFVSTTHF